MDETREKQLYEKQIENKIKYDESQMCMMSKRKKNISLHMRMLYPSSDYSYGFLSKSATA